MLRFLLIIPLFFIKISIIGQPKIIIDPDSRQTGKLSLNDMVESIEYIPLETTDDCLLRTVKSFILSDNYILHDQGNKFFLFSRSGHFVAQIGNRGGGPGEFYNARSMHIDEKSKQVILYESYRKQLLYYNFEGRFIKTVPYDEEIQFASISNNYINDHFVIKSPNFGNTPYSYTILDRDFKIIQQQIQPMQFTMIQADLQVGKGYPFCQYEYNNLMHIRENMLNDTLYVINKDFSFTPKYIINAGKYEFSVNIRSDADLFMREISNRIVVTYLFETKDYLLISYSLQKESYGYYNKSEKKILHFSSSSGIPNDYDGGLDFWPQYQSNDQLIVFYDAYKIKEHKEKSNKQTPKGSSEAINRFEQMFQKLDSEDNPVMVIAKLKQ